MDCNECLFLPPNYFVDKTVKEMKKLWSCQCWNSLGHCYSSWWRHQWKHFPRYWPFVRGIHRWPVNSPHKGQWRGALMFSLICVWINGWINNGEAGDLRRYRAHHDVTVMYSLYHKDIDTVILVVKFQRVAIFTFRVLIKQTFSTVAA